MRILDQYGLLFAPSEKVESKLSSAVLDRTE
jgi:hypothetical protein